MSACSVFGCTNTARNESRKNERITFHRFPSKISRRDAWVKALGMEGWLPSDHSRVCSDHFTKDQFKPDCLIRLRLKEDALPRNTNPSISFQDSLQDSDTNISQESRRLKALNEEKFMENFNPDTSVRETRKVNRKIYSHNSKKNSSVYNRKGIHISSGKDMCDCLDGDCPGCHFPCAKCGSEKCGHECRGNRKWTYDSYTIDGYTVDGVPEPIKNPLLGK